MEKTFRLGIQAKIFALSLPALLLAPAWVGYRSLVDELARVQAQGHGAAFASARALSDALDERLRRVEADLKLLTGLPSIPDFFSFRELGLAEECDQHRTRVAGYTREFLQRESTYAAAGLFDRSGDVIGGTGAIDALAKFAPIRTDRPAWGKPTSHRGRWLYPVALGLADAWAVPQGYVAIALDLDVLRTALGRTTPEYRILLTDGCGTTLTPPLWEGATRLSPLTKLGIAGSELAAGIRAAELAPVSLHPTRGESLLAFAGPPVSAGWQLTLLVPAPHLYQGVDRLRAQALQTGSFSVLVALVLAAWLAKRIGHGITRLAQAADSVGEGRFDLDLPVEGGDEIGRMATAFNQMSSKVQRTQKALEQRIVEVERARDSLVQAEKLSAVGLLASGIAHELNTPLMTIGTLASNVRRIAEKVEVDRGRLGRYAAGIADEVSRASEITLHLQQYCRTRTGVLEPREVHLVDVVDRALVLVRSRKDATRIRVDSGHDLVVLGDPTQLSQVVVNLLLNALDASDGIQEVRVSCRRDGFEAADFARSPALEAASPFGQMTPLARPAAGGAAVALVVEDHGKGIPPEHMGKLFDPFFTTKPAGKGTGLGLSIVQGIVWSHGGLILVDSEPGEGTTMTVKLPAGPAPGRAA